MKKKRFKLTTFALLIACLLYGQDDLQWLIYNAKGKESVNTTSPATNNFANSLTSNMTFSGVSIPDLNYDPHVRNDLLIIYSDGTYRNTRGVTGLPTFFSGMASPSVTTVPFSAPAGKTILYGYQTNIYEQDDPPAGVRIGNIGGASPIPLGTTTPTDIISANHEVVFQKDITLIIHNPSLLQFKDNNGQETDTYSLVFDAVQESSGAHAITTGLNIFDPKDAFGTSLTPSSSLYPLPAGSPVVGESITLNPSSGLYSFVNLRPNLTANNYQPDKNGVVRYDALFTVVKNGDPVDQHTEPMRFSHDPNFLQVIDICSPSEGEYLVTYHLEFENTSTTATTTLRAEVDFPPLFDLSCIRVVAWSAKGNPCGGRVDLDPKAPRRRIFDIDDHQLLRCTQKFPQQGKGFIEFIVRVNPPYDVRDISNSLELTNPNVFFDEIPYLITDFRDLFDCESRNSNIPAFTHDTSTSHHPENKDLSKKEYKKDTIDPKEPLPSHFINGPKGGAHICSRPISKGSCSCPKRFPWSYVWGGAVVLGLIAFVFVRRRRNPTPPTPPAPLA